MPKTIKSINLVIASSLVLTTNACQSPQQNSPKITTYEIVPVPVTQLGTVNQTRKTTWTFKPVSMSKIDPKFLSKRKPNVETQLPPTPLPIETARESSFVATEMLPPATSVQVETPPEPTLVTAAEDPTDSARIMVETVLPTPTEVEQTLTELNAETTIEGIKFNLSDNILFEFDKYHVRAAAKPTLEKVNQVLTHFKDAQILIHGHTDSKGTDQYNIELSQKRAAAVKYYFVNQFQAEPTRIQTQGLGKSQPIAANTNPDGSDNPQGREKNRRVEFTIQTETRTVEIAPTSNPFGEAVKQATSAATLTQTAKTPEQWLQVANHWQEAIAFMQVVPQESANYATAQQKVGEYQNNLNYARQNAGLR